MNHKIRFGMVKKGGVGFFSDEFGESSAQLVSEEADEGGGGGGGKKMGWWKEDVQKRKLPFGVLKKGFTCDVVWVQRGKKRKKFHMHVTARHDMLDMKQQTMMSTKQEMFVSSRRTLFVFAAFNLIYLFFEMFLDEHGCSWMERKTSISK
jgi:hypothetical protein